MQEDYLDYLSSENICNCRDCRKERALAQPPFDTSIYFKQTPDLYLYKNTNIFTEKQYYLNFSYVKKEDTENNTKVKKVYKLFSKRIAQQNLFLRHIHAPKKVSSDSCFYCGRITPNIKFKNAPKLDKQACRFCFNLFFNPCVSCGNHFHINIKKEQNIKPLASVYENNFICSDCYSHTVNCNSCDNLFLYEDIIIIDPHGKICKYCFEKNGTTCSECGTNMLKNIYAQNTFDGNWFCPACWEIKKPINNYSYKPKCNFIINKNKEKPHKDKLYYGLELEVHKNKSTKSTNKIANTLKAEFFQPNFIYCKADSSIGDPESAFEIVTHPFSWLKYKQDKKEWIRMLTYLKTMSFVSNTAKNCGLHIHMSKNAFTSNQLFKFMQFIYNIKHKKFIEFISERQKRYDRNAFYYCKLNNQLHDVKRKAIEKNNRGERYTACNIIDNTIEVRIFNGTLENINFFKNFEFLNSLFEFTFLTSTKNMNVEVYKKWLFEKNKNRYVNLINFINQSKEKEM